MPRDVAGVYSLPSSNPVVTLTPIQSSGWANPTMSDIGNEITNSLDRAGRGGMTGPFGVQDGTVTAPGLRFTLDPTNGLWRSATNTWALVAAGVATLQISSTGIQILVGNLVIGGITMAYPPTSGTLGYLNVPSNLQIVNYTTIAADSGKSIDHPATDANARTFIIDSNANVPYLVGTILAFSNMAAQVLTIAITADTLFLAGQGLTGSRALAQYGVAVARKLTATTWLISGTGLT